MHTLHGVHVSHTHTHTLTHSCGGVWQYNRCLCGVCILLPPPTPTPEDIPMPPIIHTLSLSVFPLYIPPLAQPITRSKTTRPTSRCVVIITTGEWQAAFQWASGSISGEAKQTFLPLVRATCGLLEDGKMWKHLTEKTNQVHSMHCQWTRCYIIQTYSPKCPHASRFGQSKWADQKKSIKKQFKRD